MILALCGASGCIELLLQLLVYGLSNGAVLALNAIGVTVVYGSVRILNLAHGDVFALASVLMTTLITRFSVQPDWPLPILLGSLGLILGLTILLAIGLMLGIERTAFCPFRGGSPLAPLISTLGISFMLYQMALIWRTNLPSWIPQDHRSVPGLPEVPIDRIPSFLPNLDLIKLAGLPLHLVVHLSDLIMLGIACSAALGVRAFLQQSRWGRSIRAYAENPELARLCGVNPTQTTRIAFAVGGLLSGIAAFSFALYYERPVAYHGAESGLFAFAAAILGGIGNPIGALCSGLLLGILGAVSDYFLASQWTPILLQLLLLTLLTLRPAGIGAEQSEPTDSQPDDTSPLGSDFSTSSHSPRRWLLPGLVGILLSFPLLNAMLGWKAETISLEIGVFMLLALGLNLLLGWAGLLDLGYLVGFGAGAYLTALLLPTRLDFTLILGLSAALAGLFGGFKGRLTQRLRQDYLAVAMLSLGLMLPQVIANLAWTGGVGGLAALPSPQILGHRLSLPVEKYYLIVALLLGAIWASRRLLRSTIGRAWRASSADELAAVSCGINVAAYRTLAFGLSSAVAGIAGALYVGSFAYIAPDLLEFPILAMVLAMVVLGGIGNLGGAVLGALLVVGYDKLFIPWLSQALLPLQPHGLQIGSAPDLRGASYFSFGLAIYLTTLWRFRRKKA